MRVLWSRMGGAVVLALVVTAALAGGWCGQAHASREAEDVQRAVSRALEQGEARCVVALDAHMGVQDVVTLMERVKYGSPQAALRLKRVRVRVTKGSRLVTCVLFDYRSRAQCRKLRKAVRGVLKRVRPNMSAAQKYRIIHDCIIRRCRYDTSASSRGTVPARRYTAYGCLVGRRAVCSGYARAFQLVARLAGLQALYVSSGTHAWNAVRVRGRWYQVDVAWDDASGGVSHRYFLRGTRYMKAHGHHEVRKVTPRKPRLSRRDC